MSYASETGLEFLYTGNECVKVRRGSVDETGGHIAVVISHSVKQLACGAECDTVRQIRVVVYAFYAIEFAPVFDYGPVKSGVCKCLCRIMCVHHTFKVVEVAAHPDCTRIGPLIFLVEQECFFEERSRGHDRWNCRGRLRIFVREAL